MPKFASMRDIGVNYTYLDQKTVAAFKKVTTGLSLPHWNNRKKVEPRSEKDTLRKIIHFLKPVNEAAQKIGLKAQLKLRPASSSETHFHLYLTDTAHFDTIPDFVKYVLEEGGLKSPAKYKRRRVGPGSGAKRTVKPLSRKDKRKQEREQQYEQYIKPKCKECLDHFDESSTACVLSSTSEPPPSTQRSGPGSYERRKPVLKANSAKHGSWKEAKKNMRKQRELKKQANISFQKKQKEKRKGPR